MAISFTQLKWIKDIVTEQGVSYFSCASFGDPELILTPAELAYLVGEQQSQSFATRTDALAKRTLAKLTKIDCMVLETSAVIEAMGGKLSIFDLYSHTGKEIELDLNESIPQKLFEQFDFVLDPGTLEHCFNVGTAIKNMAKMCKLNGHVIHHNPLFIYNHGFFNFSPTFYFDFYTDNGFEIIDYPSLQTDSLSLTLQINTVFDIRNGRVNNLLVKRNKIVSEFAWPVQSLYQQTRLDYAKLTKTLIASTDKNTKLAIVPASTIANEMLSTLTEQELQQVTLFDQHPDKKTAIRGVQVLPTEEIKTVNPDLILISSMSYRDEIIEGLKTLITDLEKVYIPDGDRWYKATQLTHHQG